MKDKPTFSNSFGEKYHMPADGPHRVTIGNITHAEPLAEQLKTVLQREADSQRRHDEKVERLEAEIERLRERIERLRKALYAAYDDEPGWCDLTRAALGDTK